MKIERRSFFGESGRFVSETDFVRVETERDQLQRLLNERDEEVDRLRADARRYQWLNRQNSKALKKIADIPMNSTDAYIDAAIAREAKS